MLPLMIILASKLLGDVPPPNIQISEKWLPTDQYTWEINETPPITIISTSQQPNYQIISVPSNVAGLSIFCNASYPIQWDFIYDNWENSHRERIHMDKLVRTSRRAVDMFDKSTFEFVQELRLNGMDNTNSGNYTCKSVEDPDFHSSIFVFWAGNSPPYLIHSGKNKTIYQGNRGSNGQFSPLTLPCPAAITDVSVLLQKQRNNTWENVDLSMNDVSYDPKIGFTLKRPDILIDMNTVEHFKCLVDSDDNDDYVLIDARVGEAPIPPQFHESLENNATFSYNETTQTFSCCSDNWKPPNLQLLYCEHPTLCFVRKQTLGPVKNTGKRKAGTSCTTINLSFESSGLIRCSGHGVKIDREFFFPLGNGLAKFFGGGKRRNASVLLSGTPYYRWSDAQGDKMIEVTSRTKEMYEGQEVKFFCQMTTYYFADNGTKWSITWNNRSRLIQDGMERNAKVISPSYFIRTGFSSLTIKVDMNMTSVTCFVPVWNLTKWMDKTMDLIIKTPQPPTIDNLTASKGNLIQVNWYLNDTGKSLDCSFDGSPTPAILWKHDGKVISASRQVNNTSTVTMDVVHFSSHGLYICNASNFAGFAVKKFQVTVTEKTTSGQLAGYVMGGLIISIILLTGLGLLARKLKSQTAKINHLKTVAFKDVIINRENQNNGYGFNYPSSPPSIISTITLNHQDQDADTVAVIPCSEQEEENADKSLNFAFNGSYHKF